MTLLQDLDRDPLFRSTDAAYLVVDTELVIRAVNPAYLRVTARTPDDLLGRPVFEALPDDPDDPEADAVANLSASLAAVLGTGRRHRMSLQRYDVGRAARSRRRAGRYWAPVNSPLVDDRGRTVAVLHHTEDMTAAIDGVVLVRPAPVTVTGEQWQTLVAALAKETLAHAEACTTVAQLREALESRVVLEQAKGVMVALRGCAPEEAFESLRALARRSSRRLHDVAREVVDTAAGVVRGGAVITYPRRGD